MPMWLAPCTLALLFRWRFCFAFLFAFRCFIGSTDAGSLFLPDTFRKQMVRGGFCAKKIQGNGCCFARKQPASFHLLQLAWSCPLGLFHFVRGERFQQSMHAYISLIKAWCLYHSGTPAFCTTHFQSVSAARNEVLILNHIFHECLPELLTNV